MNVNVNCDVAQVEDVDVGADGGVNGDVDVNVDVNIDADVDVWGCARDGGGHGDAAWGEDADVVWHRNGHGHEHGHGARAKAQVQFTAKRLRSFTHIAAQSHAVAVTSAVSNDGAGP